MLHVYLDVHYIHNCIYNCDYYIFDAFHNASRSALNTPLRFLQVQFQPIQVYTSNIQDVCQSSIEIASAVCAYFFLSSVALYTFNIANIDF